MNQREELSVFVSQAFGAPKRVPRLSHSLLLVTAFCVFVWIAVRLELYTCPSFFPCKHTPAVFDVRAHLSSEWHKFFEMTHETSSCAANPKILLWPTNIAENNFYGGLLNGKQPQMELHFSASTLNPSTATTQCAVCCCPCSHRHPPG